MVSALAVDHRRGPPLPPEFRVPERRPEPIKKSPLPDDWSDATKDLRDIANMIGEIIEGR
jgi:hypothetical protein